MHLRRTPAVKADVVRVVHVLSLFQHGLRPLLHCAWPGGTRGNTGPGMGQAAASQRPVREIRPCLPSWIQPSPAPRIASDMATQCLGERRRRCEATTPAPAGLELKQQLLNHEYFDTELLFVSPSGNGLKWIIPVDLKGWEHSRYFKAVANYIKATGLPLVDMSGSDVARSCFLPYDPQAYINHKYKDDVEENIFRPRLGKCPLKYSKYIRHVFPYI